VRNGVRRIKELMRDDLLHINFLFLSLLNL
jgi:hypothetical protein